MPKIRAILVPFWALNNYVDSKTRHCNTHVTDIQVAVFRSCMIYLQRLLYDTIFRTTLAKNQDFFRNDGQFQDFYRPDFFLHFQDFARPAGTLKVIAFSNCLKTPSLVTQS